MIDINKLKCKCGNSCLYVDNVDSQIARVYCDNCGRTTNWYANKTVKSGEEIALKAWKDNKYDHFQNFTLKHQSDDDGHPEFIYEFINDGVIVTQIYRNSYFAYSHKDFISWNELRMGSQKIKSVKEI